MDSLNLAIVKIPRPDSSVAAYPQPPANHQTIFSIAARRFFVGPAYPVSIPVAVMARNTLVGLSNSPSALRPATKCGDINALDPPLKFHRRPDNQRLRLGIRVAICISSAQIQMPAHRVSGINHQDGAHSASSASSISPNSQPHLSAQINAGKWQAASSRVLRNRHLRFPFLRVHRARGQTVVVHTLLAQFGLGRHGHWLAPRHARHIEAQPASRFRFTDFPSRVKNYSGTALQANGYFTVV